MRRRNRISTSKVSTTDRESSAAAFLESVCPVRPKLAIILGSGFHGIASRLERPLAVPYRKIPHFKQPGVEGHAGYVYAGWLASTPALLLSGRSHYYEGWSLDEVTFPVRVLARLGVPNLLLTNSAGGISNRLAPGDLMLINDHINFMGANPLRGADRSQGSFVDMSRAYDGDLSRLLRIAARKARIKLAQGIYLAVSGPSYETPAEIRAFRKLGADVVGMSTVPETIVARACGLRVAAVSCISNKAAGLAARTITHQEVLETARKVERKAAALIESFAGLLGRADF